MSRKISVFRSVESQAQYYAAYQAMLGKWPVPYEELYIPTRFGDTHVIASGAKDAPALILIHSAGSGAAQWFRNVGPFSQHYRTYAVDVIGEVNESITIRRFRHRQDCVEWANDLLDGLGIGQADIVGNSYGGFLAFNSALYLRERVKKIVLISPAATFVQMWAFYLHIAFPYKIGYMFHSNRTILSGFNWIWQDFAREAVFQEYSELGKICGFPCNQLPPPVYDDEELRCIQTPILLLIGDHEVIYKPERAIERANRLVPGLKAKIVPNANHNAQVTAPDIVNSMILEFLLAE
jgi:pimeloyl-ACP methyl ester carboxylesterase